MRINQNISAMNTYSRLTAANNAKTNSLAKLSSGLRINKAGDDAAGLAISEKMRGQVGGLKQAIRNAQDGISLIQTAEGALNETHSILNRMRELAVQAANGTNTDADREEIQKEINQLVEEISRIADTTQFNNQNLLDGEFATRFHIGANNGQGMDLKIGGMDAVALGLVENATGEDATAAVITGNDISEILKLIFYYLELLQLMDKK
jgi:flagellin